MRDTEIWDGADRICQTAPTMDDLPWTGRNGTPLLTAQPRLLAGHADWSHLTYDFSAKLIGFTANGSAAPIENEMDVALDKKLRERGVYADLSIAQTSVRNSDGSITFTIEVDNTGPATAPDILFGTNGADCILGMGGIDTIWGLGGNDFISGGAGNDFLHGGSGNDTIFGGAGSDQEFGEDGDDTLFGEADGDGLSGGFGDDALVGGPGTDLCNGFPVRTRSSRVSSKRRVGGALSHAATREREVLPFERPFASVGRHHPQKRYPEAPDGPSSAADCAAHSPRRPSSSPSNRGDCAILANRVGQSATITIVTQPTARSRSPS